MTVTRMCVSCKKRKPKNELIRISKNNGIAVVDDDKRQNSRAIYICKEKKCFDILKKSNATKRLLNAESNEDLFNEINKTIDKKGE